MKLFEDLPSQNRPITAENLNQIQDNLVVVSATEPTGDDREKVWMKKGKNLFDKNNPNSIFAYIDTTNNIFNEQEDAKSVYVKIRPNTTYTISKTSGKTFRVATSANIPQKSGSIISTVANHTGNSITINAGSNANYLFINYYNTQNGDTANENDMRNSIQVEQGSIATAYETYIEPKIYILNDNDVYEEFINVNEIKPTQTVTGIEFVTNEYLDGKRVYAKRVDLGTLPNKTNKTVETGISGNYNIIKVDTIAIKSDRTSVIEIGRATSSATLSWYLNITGNNIYSFVMQATDDRSSYSGYATIYYTK